MRHKGVSYLHLEWVKREELDKIEFKSTGALNRFVKKAEASGKDPDSLILFVSEESVTVDSILDCIDAVIEVNKDLYVTGWRMLSANEEIPEGIKIYNLPKPWRERLGEKLKKKSSKKGTDDASGANPFINLDKDISRFIPADENNQVPEKNGSVYIFERVYLVKWLDLSIAEASWERLCDINASDKVESFVKYSTISPQFYEYYQDFIPENYISIYDKNRNLSLYEPVLTVLPTKDKSDAEKPRKPRKPKESSIKRRVKNLRNCIDPIAPPFDRGNFPLLN